MPKLTHFRLQNGINLYIHPTAKFKTILVQMFLHRHLSGEEATACSLLPSVLHRGTRNYPTRRLLAEKLDELYGSELMADVLKKGERHLVSFILDIVHDKYLPGENGLLRKGLEIMREVVADPLTENGVFKSEYVEQEKEQHEKLIRGLINDKMAYTLERCLQEMCKDEPFGVFKYGSLEKLKEIDEASLYRYYEEVLAESPADLHVIGNVDESEVRNLAEEIFNFKRGREIDIPPTGVRGDVSEVKHVREELNVNQAKLVLGFRTGLSSADNDYFPLLVYNGILGGFSHSKLFQNVREKASLAYYAFSRLEKHKGLLVIAAGIEDRNYERALDIINKQLESMARGDITDEEFNNTISGLRNQILVEEDSPGLLINRTLDGILAGRVEDTEQMLERLNAVTREDVVRVSEKVKLDTVYFLTGKGGARSE